MQNGDNPPRDKGFALRFGWAFDALWAVVRGGGQKAFASALGVSQATVSRWRNGQVPSIPEAVAIGREMGVDPGWLFFSGYTSAQAPPGWEAVERRIREQDANALARKSEPMTPEEAAELEERLRDKNKTPQKRGKGTKRRPA